MAPETDAREDRRVTWCQSHQFRFICQVTCRAPRDSWCPKYRVCGEPFMGILCLRIPGVSNRRMATENPDARKSLRSDAVHGAWDKHRASRKLAFAWFAHPDRKSTRLNSS